LLFFAISTIYAQRIAENTYWYYFTDKEENGYSVNQPLDFLSERSVERRAWQSIPVDETDLPVTQMYVDSLASLGLQVLYTSRWLNGVLISSSDADLIDTLHRLSFIDTLAWQPHENTRYFPGPPAGERFSLRSVAPAPLPYGFSGDQVRQLKVHYLHEEGYTGDGVRIAVLDAGFSNLENIPGFTSLVANGQLIATRNFVNRDETVFGSHSHGTNVSSIIAGYLPDTLIGTAPDAELLLGMTENPASETRIEEYSWIEGAEWADSLGADIINTSLGYSVFDDPSTNYTYESMDGRTAHSSIANGMTAAKGMVSVTSAGNQGNDTSWYYIGAPADAKNILAVGAVDVSGNISSFSSRGPTYDHRIKPEVVAMGVLTVVQGSDGRARRGSGTSFASPLIAGATASLWQAYPALSATELMRWIIESADQYKTADATYGYGIPSFRGAYWAITSSPRNENFPQIKVYPNPVNDHVSIEIPVSGNGQYMVKLYDIQGRIVFSKAANLPGRVSISQEIKPGMYILEAARQHKYFRTRIIKN